MNLLSVIKMRYKISLYLQTVLYFLAGINHFLNTNFYIKLIPSYLPFPKNLVYISGIAEILLALFLLSTKFRIWAIWLIMAMLIAFLPIHIQMIIDAYNNKNEVLLWITIIRLPLQFVLIYWIYSLRQRESFN